MDVKNKTQYFENLNIILNKYDDFFHDSEIVLKHIKMNYYIKKINNYLKIPIKLIETQKFLEKIFFGL